MWARVRGAACLHLTRPEPKQIALVLEHPPYLASHRGIVAPIAKAPPNASATSFGFECGQVFSADQSTIVEQSQQDQQIRGQMGEFAVAPLIFFPADLDRRFI